jgi:hypothetical protein
MAVAHRLGSSFRFNFDSATETSALVYGHRVIAPSMAARIQVRAVMVI